MNLDSSSITLARFNLRARIAHVFAMDEFKPTGNRTFCNKAAAMLAGFYKYPDFNGLVANHEIKLMQQNLSWLKVDSNVAALFANLGALVFAAQAAAVHGHIVGLLPDPPVWSKIWRKHAPLCLDIGARHTIGKSTAWAFVNEPAYFVLRRSAPWELPTE